MPGQEILGEDLAPFEHRPLAVRPEDAQPLFPEHVDNAQSERLFRADHGQVDALGPGEGEQAGDIVGGDVDTGGHGADAGIAGRTEEFRSLRRLGQFPDERVFAAAATYHENFHGPRSVR